MKQIFKTIFFSLWIFASLTWYSLSFKQDSNTTLFNGDPSINPYFWGTWRPNLYFGLKTLSIETLLTGLMWFNPNDLQTIVDMRHECKEDNQIESYGYQIHNGLDYAMQTIKDTQINAKLTIQWMKKSVGSNGGDWIARIQGRPLEKNKPFSISVIFYSGLEGENGRPHLPYTTHSKIENQFLFFQGENPLLGNFSMFLHLVDTSSLNIVPHVTGLDIPEGSLWQIKNYIQSYFNKKASKVKDISHLTSSIFQLPTSSEVTSGHVAAVQLDFNDPFEFDISFVSHAAHSQMSPLEVAHELSKAFAKESIQRQTQFDHRFEATFELTKKGFNANQVTMAKYALSNLIGGMGFFSGQIRINDAPDMEEEKFNALYYPQHEEEEERYWSQLKKNEKHRFSSSGTLFTATPSRSFFPRGFMWDEGFHQLLLATWDPFLSQFCLSSWYDRLDEHGWMAREQILGPEAESKVPEAFLVQSTHIANPPALMLALSKLLHMKSNVTQQPHFLTMTQYNTFPIYSSATMEMPFKSWFQQMFSKFELQFKWYLKTQKGIHNQYGRSYSNDFVFRWRGRTNEHNFASGLDDYPRSDPPHIGELHVDLLAWMYAYARFLEDLAHLLNEKVSYYQQLRELMDQNLKQYFFHPEHRVFCDLTVSADEFETEYSLHKGYVSLLPWLLNLDLRGQYYESGLTLLKSLMTKHGIASLHASDPNYRSKENYWRGNIWLNFQFLALRALHHHQQHDPVHAAELYVELRKKIILTLSNEFQQSGFIYETYDEQTGKGLRSHPFTGWSSLILLIMAEKY